MRAYAGDGTELRFGEIDIQPGPAFITWSASSGRIDPAPCNHGNFGMGCPSIDVAGLFPAGPGEVTITATVGNVSAKLAVSVAP